MSWSISASGPKAEVGTTLANLVKNPQDGDAGQFERARAHAIADVSNAKGTHVSVSGSGHEDATSSYESLSINSSTP